MCRTMVALAMAVLAVALVPRCYGQESTTSGLVTEAQAPTIDELLLFFPSKFPNGDWNPSDLKFENVFFSEPPTNQNNSSPLKMLITMTG